MTIGFLLISILGMIVFFGAHDHPVGGLFIGLTGVYARLARDRPPGHRPEGRSLDRWT
jgi:hypothetical protein